MTDPAIVCEVVRRFLANQAPGQRQRSKKLTRPINAPRGIDKAIVKDNGKTTPAVEEAAAQNKRDIRPADVFSPTPNVMGVRNLAETSKDQSKVLKNQVKKDKGYGVVNQLSQYLIQTSGGGGEKPVKKK